MRAHIWMVVRGARDATLLVLLVIVAGFSLAYLYDPRNTPDHLWWIRRFVTVVVPGFVLCAALAAQGLLARLPTVWSRAAAVAVGLFLVFFTARADALIVTFAEDEGLFAQIEQLAKSLPPDEPIVTDGHKSWVTPLYIAFDRHMIPVDLTTSRGRDAWNSWARRQNDAHHPAYLLTEVKQHGRPSLTVGQFDLSRTITGPTVHPLPRTTITLEWRMDLVKATEQVPVWIGPPIPVQRPLVDPQAGLSSARSPS